MRHHKESLDRLGAAFQIEIDPKTRDQHLNAISAAVKSPPPATTSRLAGFRRRLAVGLASLMGVMSLAGVAVAAEDALPGELLYPVKRVTERVRGVFDDDLAATHRIEEVETLIDTNGDPALIAETVDAAEDALAVLADSGDLTQRLEQSRERIRNRGQDGTGQGSPGSGSGNGLPGAGSGNGPPGTENEEAPGADPEPAGTPDGTSVQDSGSGPANDGAGPGGNPPPTGGGSQGNGSQGDGSGISGATQPGGNGGSGSAGSEGNSSGGSGGTAGKGRP